MTDETKLREDIDRGAHADRIKNDPFVIEAFQTIESKIEDSWKRSDGEDSELRERAYLMYRLTQNFKQYFITAIANGDFSHRELLSLKQEDD